MPGPEIDGTGHAVIVFVAITLPLVLLMRAESTELPVDEPLRVKVIELPEEELRVK